MKNTASIKRNFIMNAILTMSSFIFPLISFKYASQILLPIGTGKVSFAVSIVSYFDLFAQLGIPTYGVRACAQVRDNKEKLSRTVLELLRINLVMCVFTYAAFAIALVCVPRLQSERTLYIIVSLTILLNSIGMEWLYRGLEKYSYITFRSIVFKAIALLALFLLIHEKEDYILYGVITIFASSASNIMNFIHAHKYIDFRQRHDLNLRRHWKSIGVFFAMACATTIYTHLDMVMLGFMTSDADVGYYHAAIRIKQILVSIVTSLGAVLLPRSSYYVERGEMASFYRITRKALSFVFLFAVPLMVYFAIFAEQGIFFLSSTAFAESIRPMQIIMPTLLFIGITNILGIQMLVPLGREKTVLYSEIAGAITDLILNALFIPGMHAAGAAIGTLMAEFVVLVVQYIGLRKENISEQFHNIHYGNIAIAVLLAVLSSVWIRKMVFVSNATWNSFIILVISAILFFSVYVLTLILKHEDLAIEVMKSVEARLKRK